MKKQLDIVKEVRIDTVRRAIPRSCYEKSLFRTFFSGILDIFLYLTAMAGVFYFDPWPLKLLFGGLAGCAVAFMFVWAHDAAHGALFRSKRLSEVLGTIFMLPSFNMYRLWILGHNRVHHGFTIFTPIDWIWRPLSPEQYSSRAWYKRWFYQMERTPYFCALHYLVHVWLTKMVLFLPEASFRERAFYRLNKLIALGFFAVLASLAWVLGGGAMGVLAGVAVPFVVFNYFIALFVYLHHTHPDIPFFDKRGEWSMTLGQLYCTTVVRCSRVAEFLTQNILIHVPHHVDSRIPFYRLEQAYEALKASYGEFIHEYRFSWREVFRIFARCKLYDYEAKAWLTFKEAAAMRVKNARLVA